MKRYSYYLGARPSFLEGIARLMDFGNTLDKYKSYPSGAEADYAAIARDWAMIGLDFRNAVVEFEEEKAEHCSNRDSDRAVEEKGISVGE